MSVRTPQDIPAVFAASQPTVPSEVTLAKARNINAGNFGDDDSTGGRLQNPKFKTMKVVTSASYIVLMICTLATVITYAMLWIYIVPPIRLSETGNTWTFIFLFSTTGLTFVLSVLIVSMAISNEHTLMWKPVFVCDLLMFLIFFGMWFTYLGVMETRRDFSSCNDDQTCIEERNIAPMTFTMFGKYIQQHCGKYSKNMGQPDFTTNIIDIYRMHKEGVVVNEWNLNPDKCAKTEDLKIIIYSMPIWSGIMFLAMCVESLYGVGSLRLRNEKEFVY